MPASHQGLEIAWARISSDALHGSKCFSILVRASGAKTSARQHDWISSASLSVLAAGLAVSCQQ